MSINIEEMKARCRELDPSLAVYMVRDTLEVEAAGLLDLAWALSSGCHKNDALGFFDLLEEYLIKRDERCDSSRFFESLAECQEKRNVYYPALNYTNPIDNVIDLFYSLEYSIGMLKGINVTISRRVDCDVWVIRSGYFCLNNSGKWLLEHDIYNFEVDFFKFHFWKSPFEAEDFWKSMMKRLFNYTDEYAEERCK